METVQALGDPTAFATAAGLAAKQVKDVVVAKIQAHAQVEVARIENGYRQEGGAHRADDYQRWIADAGSNNIVVAIG